MSACAHIKENIYLVKEKKKKKKKTRKRGTNGIQTETAT